MAPSEAITESEAGTVPLAATDTVFPGGAYHMGNLSHTLELPDAHGTLPARNTKPEVRWNGDTGSWESISNPLGVLDNVPAPSHLVFETTAFDNHTVRGDACLSMHARAAGNRGSEQGK